VEPHETEKERINEQGAPLVPNEDAGMLYESDGAPFFFAETIPVDAYRDGRFLLVI
jgi:hypothetical protein